MTTTKTIAQLEDELQTIDTIIARERADEQRGTTRFSRVPGLLAERDQVVAAIQLAREPKDQALALAQAIIALRTHDPIMIARLLRERVPALAAKRNELLEAAKKLAVRGFFDQNSCADMETNADMAEMRAAIAQDGAENE